MSYWEAIKEFGEFLQECALLIVFAILASCLTAYLIYVLSPISAVLTTIVLILMIAFTVITMIWIDENF